MNKLFIAAAVFATSFSAVAGGEASSQPAQQFASTASREQVRAELARAIANDQLSAGERAYVAPARQGSALSRAQVRAQLDSARRNNELHSGEFAVAGPASARAPR